MNPACGGCIFWRGKPTASHGECHRMPPQFDAQISRWPTTDRGDWCGCHRPYEIAPESAPKPKRRTK